MVCLVGTAWAAAVLDPCDIAGICGGTCYLKCASSNCGVANTIVIVVLPSGSVTWRMRIR